MTYCGTPLIDPDRGDQAMAAMLTALADRRSFHHGRVLIIVELAEAGRAHEALTWAAQTLDLPLHCYRSWDRPYLARRPDPTYDSIHTKKDLSNMARLRRRLDRAVDGQVQLVDRSKDPTAVDEIIRLEAEGYKAKTGVAMTTVSGEPEYFREMCDRFRDRGRLHVYTLEDKNVVCAVVMLLEGADGLFMIKVGYDERFARSSPGMQLHLDLIRHFHDQLDLDWIDVCTYEGNQPLLRMYPDRKRFTSYVVPLSRNPLDRLAARSLVAAPHLKRMLAEVKEKCARAGSRERR